MYQLVVDIYEELYKQATLRPPGWEYKPSHADRQLIVDFIYWIEETYPHQTGVSTFLIKYFEFQFSRYVGVRTKYGQNNIMMNWLIGPKARQEWKKRKINKRWLVRWRINRDFKLRLYRAINSTIKSQGELNKKVLNHIITYEEVEKARFLNEPKGYVYCALMTTLFNPRSKNCRICVFNKTCEQRLKNSYPKLYEQRIGTAG